VQSLLRDRRSVVLQLQDALEELVKAEQLRPGDQIPSESDLAERFGVARGSVREALKLLEQDGLIDVFHGRGRFVSATAGLDVKRPITRFESVTDMLAALGYDTRNEVVSVRIGGASESEALALRLSDDATVVRLTRLRLRLDDGVALIVSTNVFSADLLDGAAADEEDFSGSLAEWFAARSHSLVSSAADIRAVICPPELAGFPGVDADQPWLLISEHCVDQRGSPVLLSEDLHRGDVFTFHVLRRIAA
jgi:GntR family transcriptional regulator